MGISLGCLAALDESIEAGRTEMNEITPVPETELAERKMAVLRKKKPLGLPKPVPKRAYPKGWSADPRVREKSRKLERKKFRHAREKKAKAEKLSKKSGKDEKKMKKTKSEKKKKNFERRMKSLLPLEKA